MTWPLAYIAALALALILSTLLTLGCIAIAPKLGWVDIPLHEAHKHHRQSTPVLGGLAMLCSWLITLFAGGAVALWAPRLLGVEMQETLRGVPAIRHSLIVLILGSIAVTLLGMADDKKAMKALPKFLGQAIVAITTVSFGMRLSIFPQTPIIGSLLTILWIMTLMNAMNFFDNMDGLAAGASLLAALFLMFVAVYRGQHFVATLAAMTIGATAGFLLFNAPPARIFMGDGGSHFLGYILAILGILTTYYIQGETPTPAPRLIPLFAVGVPLADAVAVVLIRLRLGCPIYKGDNRHISHRFEHLGLTRPQAVLLVLLLCFIVGTAGLTLLWLPPIGSLLVLAMVAAVFTLISIIQFHVKENQQ